MEIGDLLLDIGKRCPPGQAVPPKPATQLIQAPIPPTNQSILPTHLVHLPSKPPPHPLGFLCAWFWDGLSEGLLYRRLALSASGLKTCCVPEANRARRHSGHPCLHLRPLLRLAPRPSPLGPRLARPGAPAPGPRGARPRRTGARSRCASGPGGQGVLEPSARRPSRIAEWGGESQQGPAEWRAAGGQPGGERRGRTRGARRETHRGLLADESAVCPQRLAGLNTAWI